MKFFIKKSKYKYILALIVFLLLIVSIFTITSNRNKILTLESIISVESNSSSNEISDRNVIVIKDSDKYEFVEYKDSRFNAAQFSLVIETENVIGDNLISVYIIDIEKPHFFSLNWEVKYPLYQIGFLKSDFNEVIELAKNENLKQGFYEGSEAREVDLLQESSDLEEAEIGDLELSSEIIEINEIKIRAASECPLSDEDRINSKFEAFDRCRIKRIEEIMIEEGYDTDQVDNVLADEEIVEDTD
jgi:hypothetical protein